MVKKDLITILLNKGIVSQDQLNECSTKISTTGQSMAECLIEQQFVTAEDIARAYAEQYGLPYIEKITEKMADPTLLGKIPLKFLRQNVIMPILYNNVVTLVTANPTLFQPLDELTMLLGGEVQRAVATPAAIIDGINRYYPLEGTKQMIEELEEEKGMPEAMEFEEIEEKDILTMAGEAPIIKLVNHIFVQAVKRGASDIHIEPYEKEVRVRYRIDGIMYPAFTPPKRVQAALASRIKIMANLNIAEKRLPQDGRIQIKVADKAIDIRVSVLPVTFGERIVMRLLDKSKTFGALEQLGFSERDFDVIKKSIARANGIILVSGPTGSGKTSTLYSILSRLNKPEVNVVTVEDPVEYQMAGIGQVQVNAKVGLTFAAALRSILRQDPDIVMIGETRDQETAQIAIQAALTGHLVLTTIHTNNAPASITRLIDMGIEPFLIASSVVSVLAQRLVRKLCPKSKQPYKPDDEVLRLLGLSKEKAAAITFYKPVGCEECVNGYKGRLAIFEIMEMTNEVAKLTIEKADASVIRRQAVADGMTLLIQDGIRKITEGLTTPEEVLRVATSEEDQPE
jgi:general secretion pathway protein E